MFGELENECTSTTTPKPAHFTVVINEKGTTVTSHERNEVPKSGARGGIDVYAGGA